MHKLSLHTELIECKHIIIWLKVWHLNVKWQMSLKYLFDVAGRNTQHQTPLDHSKSGPVHYLDPHCLSLFIQSINSFYQFEFVTVQNIPLFSIMGRLFSKSLDSIFSLLEITFCVFGVALCNGIRTNLCFCLLQTKKTFFTWTKLRFTTKAR